MREEYIRLFNFLPEPYRTQAITNFNEQNSFDTVVRLNDRIHTALDLGMNWNMTPEGKRYWQLLHDRILTGNIKLSPAIPFYDKYLTSCDKSI